MSLHYLILILIKKIMDMSFHQAAQVDRVFFSRKKGKMTDIPAERFSLDFHLSFTCKQH